MTFCILNVKMKCVIFLLLINLLHCYCQVEEKLPLYCKLIACLPPRCKKGEVVKLPDPKRGICCPYCCPDLECIAKCKTVSCRVCLKNQISVPPNSTDCNCCRICVDKPVLTCANVLCLPQQEIVDFCKENGKAFVPPNHTIKNCCGKCV